MLKGTKANVLDAIGGTPIVKLNVVTKDVESEIYVVAPFPPPPLVSRVQDLLMTYTKVYRNFCYDVFGKTLLKTTEPYSY